MKTIESRMESVLMDTLQYCLTDLSRRAVNDRGSCMYRLECEDGTVKMCAAGRYMDEGLYHAGMETNSIGDEDVFYALRGEVRDLPRSFFVKLQCMHDDDMRGDNSDEDIKHTIRWRLESISKRFGVDVTKAIKYVNEVDIKR